MPSSKAQVVAALDAARVLALALPGDAPPDPDPPTGGGGTPVWTKLATGGAFGAYFRRPVMLPNGDVWMAWGPNNLPDNGSFIFRRAPKVFERTSTTPGIGFDIGKRENYGACFRDNGVVIVGPGAPVAYGQMGTLALDTATGVYSELFPVSPSFGGDDSTLLHHAGYLYAFGGWPNLTLRRRSLATGAITAYGGTGPQFTRQPSYGPDEQESPRLTYVRSGMRTNGTIWALANDNELWMCPPGGAWAMHPTTGDKPSTLGLVATLVESRNCIVAWSGRTGMTTLGTLLRQTWILDLATLVWSKGPGAAAGDVVPPASTTACVNLLSNGTDVLAVIDVQGGLTDVWVMQWGSP